MADASSIRYAATLPAATGRNRGSLRFDSTNNAAKVSDGSDFVRFSVGPAVSYIQPAGTTFATTTFFVAPAACKVTAVSQVHSTAGSDGSAVTAVVTKDTGTAVPGAGTSLHASGSFNLKGTANTVQTATLSGTAATLQLAAGDRLAIKLTGTATAVAGLTVTVQLAWL